MFTIIKINQKAGKLFISYGLFMQWNTKHPLELYVNIKQ